MAKETVDAVIVGAGASGCVLARELALAGLRVLPLERGPKINPDEFYRHDEILKMGVRPKPWSDVPFAPGEFFAMVRSHTVQGFYGHPRWGGNRGRETWKVIGYHDWWA